MRWIGNYDLIKFKVGTLDSWMCWLQHLHVVIPLDLAPLLLK
jgi:hypothetical protein